ncbi:hypothetical protein [Fictibacillus sp. 18YEL24]|uniref:hypothetical protein n=1 Tax=Fictibacillus sp. 18YEL24 TaxID=2745875 RepID=UPI0018CDF5E3|nr:hypothetical protein [Fictibacillus sp. 18YEL24]MBH0170995.1 hypothetical protein [Fictibacillus sp. 18YEL24]
MFRHKKIERVGTISEFMQRKHNFSELKVKDYSKYKAVATGALVPLIFAPKAFAAESINQCGQVLAVSSTTAAVPVNAVTDKVMGDVISAFAHLFDPLIDLMIAISFPVASAMIVWKIFCGFFKDQGEIWEGIGKVSIVYLLVQMSPIFIKILKSLGTLAVGI